MSLTTPTVTGYSPFWQLTGDRIPYAMLTGQARSKSAQYIARETKRGSNRDVTGALAALIGAAAGGTATNQYRRVAAPTGPSAATPVASGIGDFSGNRTIDTIDAINRATTAADVTELKKWFNNTLLEAGITYPTVTGPNISAGSQKFGQPSF